METLTIEGVIVFCNRYCATISNLAETYKVIYKTLVTRRNQPVMNDESAKEHSFNRKMMVTAYKDLETRIMSAIRFCLSLDFHICKFLEPLESQDQAARALPIEEFESLKKFVNEAAGAMEFMRGLCIDSIKIVIDCELERSSSYFGFQRYSSFYPPDMSKKTDKKNCVELKVLRHAWQSWIKIVPLVVENEFSSLPLCTFLDTTDAIHLYYWETYMTFYRDLRKNSSYFTKLTKTVLRMGFPGPPILLKKAATSRSQLFDFHNAQGRSFEIARNLHEFHEQFFLDSVYRRLIMGCMRKTIPYMDDLYVEMRRSLVFYLRWFFGVEVLPMKIGEALDRIGLMFCKCIEVLKRCRLMAESCQSEKFIGSELEIACEVDIREIYAELGTFEEDFIRDRNVCVCRMVFEHYEATKKIVNFDLAKFAVKSATMMSTKGYEVKTFPADVRNDFGNLFSAHFQFITLTENAMRDTNPETKQIVAMEGYNTAIGRFRNTEECILQSIDKMKSIGAKGSMTFKKVWLSMPLIREIREIAQVYLNSGISAEEGWMPNFEDESVIVKTDLLYLTNEKTNPLEDAHINDTQFRRLFRAEQFIEIVNPNQ